MTLQEYIDETGSTYTRFARLLGDTTSSVRRYCLPAGHKDRRVPRPAKMARIVELTGGRVTANDFYGQPAGRAA